METPARMKNVVEWVNEAKDPVERARRKSVVFGYTYGAGDLKLSRIAKSEPKVNFWACFWRKLYKSDSPRHRPKT